MGSLKEKLHSYRRRGKERADQGCVFNRLGEMRDRSFENQRYRASGLNLVVAAIILWNTVYLSRAIRCLKEHGLSSYENLLQHLSPLGWEHINLTGDYVWRQNKRVEHGKFRTLRPLAGAIAVGVPIAEHPPHRSRRAYFTHRAPTLGI